MKIAKLSKFLIITILCALLLGGGLIFYFFYNHFKNGVVFYDRKAPYPYVVNSTYTENKKLTEDLREAKLIHLLIIGDQNANEWQSVEHIIKKQLSENTNLPLRIKIISKKGFSLARINHYLKMRKRAPTILMYQVGSSDLSEKKFNLKDRKDIYFNLNRYESYSKNFLFSILPPFFDQYFYRPVSTQYLSDKAIDFSIPKKNDLIKVMNLNVRLYQHELRDLVSYAQKNSIHLFALTLPINLRIRPKNVCPEADIELYNQKLKELQGLVGSERFKEGLSFCQKNFSTYKLHSKFAYNCGELYFKTKNFVEAIKAYQLANAMSCDFKGPNILFNKMTKDIFSKYGFSVIDFQGYLEAKFGYIELFLDDKEVQSVHLEYMADEIVKKVRQSLLLP